jgi:hypothetical protein
VWFINIGSKSLLLLLLLLEDVSVDARIILN